MHLKYHLTTETLAHFELLLVVKVNVNIGQGMENKSIVV